MSEYDSASESESGRGSESGSEFGPTPKRHPGGTQEAPRRPSGGTQETPRRHPEEGGTRRHPGSSQPKRSI